MTLDEYIQRLRECFLENESDRYAAHTQSREFLLEMARDQRILHEIIKKNLSNLQFLQKTRHYSTLAMTIHEDSEFSVMLNIYPPLPDRRSDTSFQSVHHHGNLILTSVAAFGPGYSSLLFKRGFQIDPDTGQTLMELEKEYQNKLYDVGFVDANQPHIVFYPSDFSGTYALWSDYKKSTKDVAKRLGIVRKLKKPLSKIVTMLGLGRLLGLNTVRYFDFYPDNGKLIAMKEREAYIAEGSNENFLQNIFCFVQKTGFTDDAFIQDLIGKQEVPAEAKHFMRMLLRGETIVDSFFEGHIDVPKVNLRKIEVLSVVK